jgi:dihydropteroate synthase
MKRTILKLLEDKPWLVMGILNVTPDSFSDGGLFYTREKAVQHALQMEQQGADIVDIGGESTRPGADSVPADEELERVIPVIEAIRRNSDIAISVDTSKPEVMREALAAGADMVNDVNALQAEGAVELCTEHQTPVCLMHKQGTPKTMQERPSYRDVLEDVSEFLLQRAKICETAGLGRENIILDPGFGFGKTLENNLSLLKGIDHLCATGYPLLVGISRKSMFGQLLGRDLDQRLAASITAAVLACQKGARIFRVHDVAETCDALRVCDAVEMAG